MKDIETEKMNLDIEKKEKKVTEIVREKGEGKEKEKKKRKKAIIKRKNMKKKEY